MSEIAMKAVVLEGEGGAEHLSIKSVPRPVPGAGEVLIKVAYASINAVDRRVREGYLRDWIPRPYIAGSDFSGIVEASGVGADFIPGTAVFGGLAPNSGAYAEYLVFKSSDLAEKPKTLSFADAAALPVAGITAWTAVMVDADLKPGDRVLIQGAAGGVGHLALQLAKLKGAYVIGTASAANLEFVRSLGADEAIDYRTADFSNQIRELSLIIDGVSTESMEKACPALKHGGMLITLFDPLPHTQDGIVAKIVSTTKIADDPITLSEKLTSLAELVVDGKLKVKISRIVELAEAGTAQELSKLGKIVIHV